VYIFILYLVFTVFAICFIVAKQSGFYTAALSIYCSNQLLYYCPRKRQQFCFSWVCFFSLDDTISWTAALNLLKFCINIYFAPSRSECVRFRWWSGSTPKCRNRFL